MLSQRKILRKVHKLTDVCLTAVAFVCAYFIKKYFLPHEIKGLIDTPNYHLIILLIGAIWAVSFNLTGLHKQYLKKPFSKSMVSLIKIVTINTTMLAFAFYLLKIQDVSRLLIGLFYLIHLTLLALSAHLFIRLRKKRVASKVLIIIIGSREAAKEFIESTLQDSLSNYQVVGCLEVDQEDVGKTVLYDVKVIGTLNDLQYFLSHYVVDELVFAAPIDRIWEAEQYMAIAEAVGVQIRILPHWHLRKFLEVRPKFYSMFFESFSGTPTLVLRPTSATKSALLAKTLFDYVFASLIFVLSLPLFVIIACAIKIVSPGPVFYKQERCSLYGRRFTLYKFRTMVVGAEAMQQELMARNEASGVVFKMKKDPRIIPYIGRVLRKYSLDELPNLFSVLRGDMSIVGPRPPLPGEVLRYELWERRRLSMKPGLTCLWQVTPYRNSIPFDKWMELDLQYIDNWSLGLDFKILLRTVKAVLFGYGM